MVNNYEVGKIYIFNSISSSSSYIMPSNAQIIILQQTNYNGTLPLPSIVIENVKRYSLSSVEIQLVGGTTMTASGITEQKSQLIFKVVKLNGSTAVPSAVKSNVFELTSLVALYKESTEEFVCLPCPSTYNGSTSTLVDSARNTKGYVVAQQIRSDIAKIEMTWNYLTGAKYAELAQMFEDKYGGSFFNKFLFFNATINNFDVREFYPSDRKFTSAKMKLDDYGMPKGFQNVPLNLIEV
mgnify:CR=1 FL=1